MFGTPWHEESEVVMQPLLVGAFAVGSSYHKIARILQQSAVKRGIRYVGKTHIVVQVRRAAAI